MTDFQSLLIHWSFFAPNMAATATSVVPFFGCLLRAHEAYVGFYVFVFIYPQRLLSSLSSRFLCVCVVGLEMGRMLEVLQAHSQVTQPPASPGVVGSSDLAEIQVIVTCRGSEVLPVDGFIEST